MAGRKTKLTPETQKAICDNLRTGLHVETSCILAGIGYTAFYEWLKKGEAGRQPFAEFAEAVKKAEAEAERLLAGTVMRVAIAPENPNWQAAMTMLERRHPERWGRRVVEAKVAVSGEMMVEHDLSDKLTTPERLRSVAEILGNLGLLPAGGTGTLQKGAEPPAEQEAET